MALEKNRDNCAYLTPHSTCGRVLGPIPRVLAASWVSPVAEESTGVRAMETPLGLERPTVSVTRFRHPRYLTDASESDRVMNYTGCRKSKTETHGLWSRHQAARAPSRSSERV